jgi:glycosyltransferase involved in cell wall biosynthesis
VNVTIAIPTYNRTDYLPALLERLRSQTGVETLSWEIWVIDNNSGDRTAEVVQSIQATWDCAAPLHYGVELQQGAAYARQRAVEVAQGEWIGFLDDDVMPAEDWIAQAVKFVQAHPQAGAIAGSIQGAFETEPPDYIACVESFLAIRNYGDRSRLFHPKRFDLPTTAALWVRRTAWLESVPKQLLLVGRVGQTHLGGEDYELLLHLHQRGWELWYCPALNAVHQIPAHRLEPDYLMSLARSSGLIVYPLNRLAAPPWQHPVVRLKTAAQGASRWLKHQLKRSHQDAFVHAFYSRFHWNTILGAFRR